MFRVVVKPYLKFNEYVYFGNNRFAESEAIPNKSPYQVGETIFVKEKFKRRMEGIYYAEDEIHFRKEYLRHSPYQSPVHMKQEHSRLTLRIRSVKVGRLQDISEEDAFKSGEIRTDEWTGTADDLDHVLAFKHWWNSTHKKPEEKFEANPWVYAYEYKVI